MRRLLPRALADEIRLPVAHLPRRLRHGADAAELGRIHHHRPREPKAARLAHRSLLRVLDQFEINVVREPQNAADFAAEKPTVSQNSRSM